MVDFLIPVFSRNVSRARILQNLQQKALSGYVSTKFVRSIKKFFLKKVEKGDKWVFVLNRASYIRNNRLKKDVVDEVYFNIVF